MLLRTERNFNSNLYMLLYYLLCPCIVSSWCEILTKQNFSLNIVRLTFFYLFIFGWLSKALHFDGKWNISFDFLLLLFKLVFFKVSAINSHRMCLLCVFYLFEIYFFCIFLHHYETEISYICYTRCCLTIVLWICFFFSLFITTVIIIIIIVYLTYVLYV